MWTLQNRLFTGLLAICYFCSVVSAIDALPQPAVFSHSTYFAVYSVEILSQYFAVYWSIFRANSQDSKTVSCTMFSVHCGVWGQTLAEVRRRSSLASSKQHSMVAIVSLHPALCM